MNYYAFSKRDADYGIIVWVCEKAYFDKHGHIESRHVGRYFGNILKDFLHEAAEAMFMPDEPMTRLEINLKLRELGFDVDNERFNRFAIRGEVSQEEWEEETRLQEGQEP